MHEEQRHIGELKAIGYTADDLVPLRELERRAHEAAEGLCSVPGYVADDEIQAIEAGVSELFGGSLPEGFFVNGDPRGYALKLDSEHGGAVSRRDWGGYGILAPARIER